MPLDLPAGVRRLFRLPPRSITALHADIDDELESLITSRVESLTGRGYTLDHARAEALRRLGADIDVARRRLHQSAETRERRMQVREYLEDLLQDLRYAARGLTRRPAFTTVAVLTLAIGIGGTTAIFSAVNVMLLRPLPYARPDELMKLSLVAPAVGELPGNDQMVWSYPKYTGFRDAQQAFAELALFTSSPYVITSGDVERITGEEVGATYFRTLGLVPSRGRDFERAIDAAAGAPREVILSTAFWERRFNADPSVIGRTIGIDAKPFTIIGIAPAGFAGLTGQGEIFVPITARPAPDLSGAQSHEFWLVGRRRRGVTAAQAAAAMPALGARVNELYRDNEAKAAWSARAVPLDDARVAPLIKRSLVVLFAAVGFVLLIACVNVANLQLGRAGARRREIAVRLAIGAGRARLIRLLVTESLLLALLGGGASLIVAWFGTHALSAMNPALAAGLERFSGMGSVNFAAIQLDWRALAFTFLLAIVIGVIFGLAPALHATRPSLTSALRDGGSDGRRDNTASAFSGRRALVVIEVALALVLLAGSGLMLRSLGKLMAVDTGFDSHNLLTLRLTIPPGALPRDSMPGFYDELIARLRAVPGVSSVALGSCAPLNGGCARTVATFPGKPPVDFAHQPLVGINWASPDYFAALGISLKRGRTFNETDPLGGAKVAVINEAAAAKMWPNEDPIGKRLALGQGGFDKGDGAEVIGVVANARQWVDSEAHPDAFVSLSQSPRGGMMVFVRSPRPVASLGPEVRRAIREIAPAYPVYDMQTMDARAAGATAQARFSAVLLGLFALTALSLAIVGIYGVMSLLVSARTREIGIRIALGADQRLVQRLVIGEGVALVAAGAAIGLAGALLCTRALQALLFDLSPADPLTYASIVAIVGVTALTASWLPARRAARVDPVVALRAD